MTFKRSNTRQRYIYRLIPNNPYFGLGSETTNCVKSNLGYHNNMYQSAFDNSSRLKVKLQPEYNVLDLLLSDGLGCVKETKQSWVCSLVSFTSLPRSSSEVIFVFAKNYKVLSWKNNTLDRSLGSSDSIDPNKHNKEVLIETNGLWLTVALLYLWT